MVLGSGLDQVTVDPGQQLAQAVGPLGAEGDERSSAQLVGPGLDAGAEAPAGLGVGPVAVEDAPLDQQQLLSRLHLKTADGKWITGLKANIRAWHHTPFRHLWRMLDWPLINLFSHRCYELWLRRRNRSR